MANSQHIEWLREGVRAWNDQRKREDFVPDLEKVNIPEVIGGFDESGGLSGIDFSRANLRKSVLNDINLTKANLNSADLTECELNKGTNLSRASLRGANLSQTRPWRADLFGSTGSTASKPELKAKRVSKVADLLDACSEARSHYESNDVLLYFRGERDHRWHLRPSVKREEGHRVAEGRMLVDLMSRRPDGFDNVNSALAQWVLARHHGLPTRLLDVTRNPLVALFQACRKETKNRCDVPGRIHIFAVSEKLIKPFNSDSISVIANFAKLSYEEQKQLLGMRKEDAPNDVDPGCHECGVSYPNALMRLYHFIGQEKPHFQKRINPRDFFRVFIVEPQQSFERIRAQSGAFLISAFHDRFEPDEILKRNDGLPIYDHYVISVPPGSKLNITEELRLLNITHETLFPGLDQSATAVIDRFGKTSEPSTHEK